MQLPQNEHGPEPILSSPASHCFQASVLNLQATELLLVTAVRQRISFEVKRRAGRAPYCTPLVPPISRPGVSLMRPQLAPERVRPGVPSGVPSRVSSRISSRIPSRIPLWRPSQLSTEFCAVLVTSQVPRGPAGPGVHAILVTPEARPHTHCPEILGGSHLPLPVFPVLL